ncbi:MAG: LysM peptidoglycan-binding domain-containing protein [Myxococcales bacterium]|nr:LysM peptidoglycan-binding domain-containing protein [Myxococcales bacterium]MCB9531113.1 LysM peptidoglycan-binding domain-containing protein [Myxococcales bacterium]MCB9533023.1 LysM peptidoglycan-binding domain-containing protein [Myxococcales bacterium]
MKKPLLLAALFCVSAATALPAARVEAQGISLSPNELQRRSYVARDGDTLFSLAERFLGDALRWPQLWAYNPQITNPHWIYPGDMIFLDGGRVESSRSFGPRDVGSNAFPLGGFYTSEELPVVGQIRFAQGPTLLSLTDTVFIEFDDPDSVHIGDIYQINRVVDRVLDDEDQLVALKYLTIGEVQVKSRHLDSDLVSAEITAGWDAIERGDVLFATRISATRVDAIPAHVDLEARIVDHLNPTRFMHEQQMVFINKGWGDGVEPGNRFIVWDRGDDVVSYGQGRRRGARRLEENQPELPWIVAGEAMVVYTAEEYSTAVIVDAGVRELYDGMRLTMQAGY